MASLSEKHNGRSMFKANAPHFFKIILDHTISDGKLTLPRKFVRMYGNYLSSPVLLRVCKGAVWKVELTKCDGEIWLHEGWKEFMEHYSVDNGHFLMFKLHQGITCHFSVVIFDKSATEIDYPLSNNVSNDVQEHNLEDEFQVPNTEEETENDSANVEIFDESLPCRKTKRKSSSLPSSRPHRRMKVDDSAREIGGKRSYRRSLSSQKHASDSDRVAAKAQTLNPVERTRALQRARAQFKSKNPFFMVLIQPSYISAKYRLSISASFALKYLKKQQGNVILNDLDGRNWCAKYYVYTLTSTQRTIAKLTCGWKAFAQENELKVGDVCAFELINSTKTTLKVSIFRCNKGEQSTSCRKPMHVQKTELSLQHIAHLAVNRKQSRGEESSSKEINRNRKPSCLNSPEANQADRKFDTINPFFQGVFTATGNTLHVPEKFIRKIKQRSTDTKLQVDDKCWPVKLKVYPHHRKSSLCTGWNTFARENSLQNGDVCIFELIDRKTMLIKVSIIKHVK